MWRIDRLIDASALRSRSIPFSQQRGFFRCLNHPSHVSLGSALGVHLIARRFAGYESSSQASEIRSALRLFGLSDSATDAEVSKAYKEYAKKHHPDSNQQRVDAKEKMERGNDAYAKLRLCKFDERKRLLDSAAAAEGNSGSSSSGGYTRERAEQVYRGRARPPNSSSSSAGYGFAYSDDSPSHNTARYNEYQERVRRMRQNHDAMGAPPWRVREDPPTGRATGQGHVFKGPFTDFMSDLRGSKSRLDDLYNEYAKNRSYGGMDGSPYDDQRAKDNAKYRMNYTNNADAYGPDDPIHGSPFMKSNAFWSQRMRGPGGTGGFSQEEIYQDYLLRRQRGEEKYAIDRAIGPRILAGIFFLILMFMTIFMLKMLFSVGTMRGYDRMTYDEERRQREEAEWRREEQKRRAWMDEALRRQQAATQEQARMAAAATGASSPPIAAVEESTPNDSQPSTTTTTSSSSSSSTTPSPVGTQPQEKKSASLFAAFVAAEHTHSEAPLTQAANARNGMNLNSGENPSSGVPHLMRAQPSRQGFFTPVPIGEMQSSQQQAAGILLAGSQSTEPPKGVYAIQSSTGSRELTEVELEEMAQLKNQLLKREGRA